ncbi:MAG: class I tRNA ligase family protein [bacterium]|nr:class I tRNA ligase family protein [bacterium]
MKKNSVKSKVSIPYDHSKIEKKWQKYWLSKKIYKATEDAGKKKFYSLIEFPYPSGDGLHVGHPRPYIGMDVVSRKRRMEGYNVLYPIGWDAFGLPTENYAIKTGIQPEVVTKKNTDTFRRQIQSLGISFDWSREINTTSPEYYKWTQWIFLQLFKKGLAYKKKMMVNWCPKDLVGLANEEVVNGACERCGTPVEKREKEQWMLAITKYAERLDKDLDDVDYIERIKIQQRNWIGKSVGAQITFNLDSENSDLMRSVEVFTTRPDTIYGVTYIVLAPEHPLVKEFIQNKSISNIEDVTEYIAKVKKVTDIERTDATKKKTGVELKGVKAINPANKQEVSVWIADYVLADYGSGAVMAVPAHDERDWDFAHTYNLPIKDVIQPLIVERTAADAVQKDLPLVERNAVVCVIKHWSEDKYLGLRWKKNGWQGLVVGGIEKGETAQDAGIREAQEETGYQNLEYVKDLGSPVHSQFYHMVKKENRFGHFHPILLKLKDDTQVTISDEENALHELVWVSASEINTFINKEDIRIMWNRVNGPACYTGEGILGNSENFNGKASQDIKKEITESVGGKWVTTFKLRDWVFSRQRYWGEPIPVVHCEKCGVVPLSEKDLPLKLPKVKNYKPTETGESPLASISKWVNTKCPQCKGKARRETDTMPQWAGSSWNYLRYTDPHNKKAFADSKKLKYWLGPAASAEASEKFGSTGGVDWYNGGMEHTTLHLLYSRFWHKVMFDLGLVPTHEPYKKRTAHGLILAEGGEKMSKSKGNVINPDTIVEKVGADTLRMYEMFMGPFDQPIAWSTDNIAGVRRFIERAWKLNEKISPESTPTVQKIIHRTIKKVSDDIESMRFNTAISSLMIALNDIEGEAGLSKNDYEHVLKLIAPFAPHMTEEMWALLGNKKSIHLSEWPTYNESLTVETEVTIIVQINGKMRGSFIAQKDASREVLEANAQAVPDAVRWLEGKNIIKIIVVPNKLVNIVITP